MTDSRLPNPLASDDRIRGTSLTVGDFWAWAYSDILDSVTRGTLAEFIVRTALSITGTVRDNGSMHDLDYQGHGIQVKSSSAVQRWQWRGEASPRMAFSIKRTRPYLLDEGRLGNDPMHSGDCWIFCVFRPPDRRLDAAQAALLNVDNWFFWAVPKNWLPTNRALLPLSALRGEFASKVGYGGLPAAVDLAIQRSVDGIPAPAVAAMTAKEWVQEEDLHLVPTERLARIVDLVVATTEALKSTGIAWTPHFQGRFAGIRTSRGGIRLQIQADLLAIDGPDVRLGLRVPLNHEAPADWPREKVVDRDFWWSVSSEDLPSADFVAGILGRLYSSP